MCATRDVWARPLSPLVEPNAAPANCSRKCRSEGNEERRETLVTWRYQPDNQRRLFQRVQWHAVMRRPIQRLDYSPTISAPILCNDGRKGIITATRDMSGLGGGGHFTLNDGTTGDFIFGASAEKL
jgi:hypothetical protein